MVNGKRNEASCVILLVEDDPAHAELVKRGFDGFTGPHRIIHVSHGEAALDYLFRRAGYADALESPRPHIILLDLRLPRLSGFDVLKEVKQDVDLRSIPVIILTTSEAREDAVMAYKLHANSFVVKPADFERFTALIKELGSYWLNWNYFTRLRKPGAAHDLASRTRQASSWDLSIRPT